MYHRQNWNVPKNQSGFTLLEVVAVLMVTAVVGTMLFQYVRASTDHTAEQMAMAQDNLALQQNMEAATSLYKATLQSYTDSTISILSGFKTDVSDQLSGSVAIDTDHTKYVSFTRDSDTMTYTPTLSDTEQNNSHLMLVLQKDEHRVFSVFSDSD